MRRDNSRMLFVVYSGILPRRYLALMNSREGPLTLNLRIDDLSYCTFATLCGWK